MNEPSKQKKLAKDYKIAVGSTEECGGKSFANDFLADEGYDIFSFLMLKEVPIFLKILGDFDLVFLDIWHDYEFSTVEKIRSINVSVPIVIIMTQYTKNKIQAELNGFKGVFVLLKECDRISSKDIIKTVKECIVLQG